MSAYVMTEEERRAAWARGRTDVDALARRTEHLCEEARRVAGRPRRGGQRTPAARENTEAWSYCLADLRASKDGRELSRRFGHNAHALARALGVSVQWVPLAELQRRDRPGVTILGRLWRLPGQPPFVQLADGLDGRQSGYTLAHEIGHALGFPDERLCSQFADAFTKVADDELPGGKWRAIQAELTARARRQAASR